MVSPHCQAHAVEPSTVETHADPLQAQVVNKDVKARLPLIVALHVAGADILAVMRIKPLISSLA